MAKVNVTSEQGILYGQINTKEWDLNKRMAQEALIIELNEMIAQADADDAKQQEVNNAQSI